MTSLYFACSARNAVPEPERQGSFELVLPETPILKGSGKSKGHFPSSIKKKTTSPSGLQHNCCVPICTHTHTHTATCALSATRETISFSRLNPGSNTWCNIITVSCTQKHYNAGEQGYSRGQISNTTMRNLYAIGLNIYPGERNEPSLSALCNFHGH